MPFKTFEEYLEEAFMIRSEYHDTSHANSLSHHNEAVKKFGGHSQSSLSGKSESSGTHIASFKRKKDANAFQDHQEDQKEHKVTAHPHAPSTMKYSGRLIP